MVDIHGFPVRSSATSFDTRKFWALCRLFWSGHPCPLCFSAITRYLIGRTFTPGKFCQEGYPCWFGANS